MKIYVVRHGQSEDGALGLYQRADSPLSPKGIKEAELIAERLTKIPVEVIYTSPLKRAWQTAETISQKIGRPIQANDWLKELKRPTKIEGRKASNPAVIKIKKEVVRRWLNSHPKAFGEETFWEFKERGQKLMEFLEKLSSKNVLLVTHCNFLRLFLSLIIFGDRLEAKEFLKIYPLTLGRGGLTTFEYSPKRSWRLLTWNDQAHLG